MAIQRQQHSASWYLLTLLLFVFMLTFGVWYALAQWKECRGMGFSEFYCLQHIL